MNDQPANVEHSPAGARAYRRRMFTQRSGVALILALIVVGCVVVYFVPPDERSYYPRCTFHALTGLHCPGCGGTRCVHALLHGDVLQAAAYNLYFFVALPFLLGWGGYGAWATFLGKQFDPPRYRPWLYSLLWISLLAFTILRNVNVVPFNWLAPHKL